MVHQQKQTTRTLFPVWYVNSFVDRALMVLGGTIVSHKCREQRSPPSDLPASVAVMLFSTTVLGTRGGMCKVHALYVGQAGYCIVVSSSVGNGKLVVKSGLRTPIPPPSKSIVSVIIPPLTGSARSPRALEQIFFSSALRLAAPRKVTSHHQNCETRTVSAAQTRILCDSLVDVNLNCQRHDRTKPCMAGAVE